MTSIANKYRPKKFSEVVGQEAEVDLVRKLLKNKWEPPAIMLTGPFGTGKTTFSRLIARALLCENLLGGEEPCGSCHSCLSMDADNNPNYIELDAASQGLVDDVRKMKDLMAYRVFGEKPRIVCYDESHMLSKQAQNALLQTLEEGKKGNIFIFATTEATKMLPTLRSRCIELQMKLLTAAQITQRVKEVALCEKVIIDERAARIIGTYVRGHVRDAMMLYEQLSQMSKESITEELARTYLRLDKNDAIYQLLILADKKEAVLALENLLCNFAPSELADSIGEILVNAYKLKIGINNNSQLDSAWLKKVLESRGDEVLDQAEAILCLRTDFTTITYGIAAFSNILFENKAKNKGPRNSLMATTPAKSELVMPTRKPSKNVATGP